MEHVYIYGLKDPRTGLIRYVGKSERPEQRYLNHKANYDKVNLHKYYWIKQLRDAGLDPQMLILETCLKADWEARERFWIAYGLSQGWPLTNIYLGGMDETREKHAPVAIDLAKELEPFCSTEQRVRLNSLSEDEQQLFARNVFKAMLELEYTLPL